MLLFVIIFLAFAMVFALKTPPSPTNDINAYFYYNLNTDIQAEKQRILNSWKKSGDFSVYSSDMIFKRIDVFLNVEKPPGFPTYSDMGVNVKELTFKNVVDINKTFDDEKETYKLLILYLKIDQHFCILK